MRGSASDPVLGWRPFSATNEPDTCLWCGRRLRREKEAFDGEGRWIDPGNRSEYTHEKPGAYGNGYFCTLRCSHQFAVAFARAGHCLQSTREAS